MYASHDVRVILINLALKLELSPQIGKYGMNSKLTAMYLHKCIPPLRKI